MLADILGAGRAAPPGKGRRAKLNWPANIKARVVYRKCGFYTLRPKSYMYIYTLVCPPAAWEAGCTGARAHGGLPTLGSTGARVALSRCVYLPCVYTLCFVTFSSSLTPFLCVYSADRRGRELHDRQGDAGAHGRVPVHSVQRRAALHQQTHRPHRRV